MSTNFYSVLSYFMKFSLLCHPLYICIKYYNSPEILDTAKSHSSDSKSLEKPGKGTQSETTSSTQESEIMAGSKKSETKASSKESETRANSKEPETLASSKESETMASSKEPETLASSKISTSTVVSLNDFQQLSLLERFRPGYLWVTDLTKQNWCEQQLFYAFTIPTVAVVEDTPVMKAGTDYHLARGTCIVFRSTVLYT